MSTASFPSERTTSLGGATASKRSGPQEHRFSPTEVQEQFLFDTHSQVLLSGTVGAGKSKIGCEKGYLLNTKYPGNRGLIVRKTFSSVRSSTINQTLIESVIPPSHIPEEGHNKGEHVITHYTGTKDPTGEPVMSEIHYHGLDSGNAAVGRIPQKIMSHEYGWIFVDEGTELAREEWDALDTRLRYDGKRQNGFWYSVPTEAWQLFTATNPAGPAHWMYDRFIHDGGQEGTNVYRMTVYDNPGVDPEYVKRLEANLVGVHRDRLLEGEWVGAEGMVYDEYDPLVHLLHPDDLPGDWTVHRESEFDATGEKSYWAVPPEDWAIYRTIDFGYTNPFVCQWWARSPDETLVLFREIYQSERRYKEHAEDINRMTPDERPVSQTVADHDAEGAETLRSEGVPTTPAKKSVSDGIQAVKKKLALDDRGRASLYFMEGARVHRPDTKRMMNKQTLKTIDEISGYVWDEAKTEKGEDVPKKKADHGMDAMRYLVYSLYGGIVLSRNEIKQWASITEGF